MRWHQRRFVFKNLKNVFASLYIAGVISCIGSIPLKFCVGTVVVNIRFRYHYNMFIFKVYFDLSVRLLRF